MREDKAVEIRLATESNTGSKATSVSLSQPDRNYGLDFEKFVCYREYFVVGTATVEEECT